MNVSSLSLCLSLSLSHTFTFTPRGAAVMKSAVSFFHTEQRLLSFSLLVFFYSLSLSLSQRVFFFQIFQTLEALHEPFVRENLTFRYLASVTDEYSLGCARSVCFFSSPFPSRSVGALRTRQRTFSRLFSYYLCSMHILLPSSTLRRRSLQTHTSNALSFSSFRSSSTARMSLFTLMRHSH